MTAFGLLEFSKAFITNNSALEKRGIIKASTENASGFVLFQNDCVFIHKDFDSVAAGKSQIFSDLDRENDSAELVNSSNNTC